MAPGHKDKYAERAYCRQSSYCPDHGSAAPTVCSSAAENASPEEVGTYAAEVFVNLVTGYTHPSGGSIRL